MRILLAAHAFPPRSTAGVEVYTLRLGKALVGLGHQVAVLCAVHDLDAGPGSVRTRSEAGLLVHEIVNVHREGTLVGTYRDPAIGAAGQAVMRDFRPEVVHFQHLLNLSSALPRAARELGAHTLLTLHDYWLSCPRDGLRMREDLELCVAMDHAICARCLADSPYLVPSSQRVLARVSRGAGLGRELHRLHAAAPRATGALLGLLRRLTPVGGDGLESAMDLRTETLRADLLSVELFLAPTRFARDRAIEFGIPAERIELRPLAVLPEPARPRRAEAPRRFGYVGTLAPHKGVHVLIQAFRACATPGLTLDLFGNPAIAPDYAARLARDAAGDVRIRFRGPFAEGGQDAVHEQLDALVLPSLWWENSPLTAIEAIAAGLPVIASRTGGVPEVVEDGVTGVLVPPGDAAALAVAIEDVAARKRPAEGQASIPFRTLSEGAADLAATYARLASAG